MSKTHEMVDIYRSWEPILQSKLSDVDHVVRQIFREMSVFGINQKMSELFMRQKFHELIQKISREGESNAQSD